MAKDIPEEIRKDLERCCALHERAVSDFEQCAAFSRLLSDVLCRLEDAGCDRAAGKVMTLLLDCNPKEGAHCDKSALVGEKIRKL